MRARPRAPSSSRSRRSAPTPAARSASIGSNEQVLICPCHQSEFDVLDGARPIFGPAARPLPQLPIRLEADGTFTALGDFPEPVGPSFWDMHR